MMVHALETGTDFSRSLADPWHRPSHAKVRSTTQSAGQHLETLLVIAASDNLDCPPALAPRRVIEFVTGITTVSWYSLATFM